MKISNFLFILLIISTTFSKESSQVVVIDFHITSDKVGWTTVGALYGSIVPIIGTVIGGAIGYVCSPKDGWYIVKSIDSSCIYSKISSKIGTYMQGDTINIIPNELTPLSTEELKRLFDSKKK